MSLTKIRSRLGNSRTSAFGLAALFLVTLVVVAAHSEPNAHAMEGHDTGMADPMSICLAILQLGAALLIGEIIRTCISKGIRAPKQVGFESPFGIVRNMLQSGHRIREGPAHLQVFRH